MGGSSGTQQTTKSTAPNSALAAPTADKLIGGVNSAFGDGTNTSYAAAGPTTQGAWAQALGAAGNPDYASGIAGALKSTANTAAGNAFGTNDPGYAALRSKLQNDVLTGTNSAFNNSGLFGSDSNQKAAASGLTDSLGALDYSNFQNDQTRQQTAIQSLPGLYAALQAPSATAGSIGAAQDANANGILNGQTDLMAKLSAILGTNATTTGTTETTTSPTAPWWQQALGAASTISGIAGDWL